MYLLGGSSGAREVPVWLPASSPGLPHHPGLSFALCGRETIIVSTPLVFFQGFSLNAATSSAQKDLVRGCCCQWQTVVTATTSVVLRRWSAVS